ncbi:uncharacterized protein KQ657_000245 [Scheffersomyces spartinae]|uniref:SAC3/GANP/THP3 conserved domain-containing protein n=1 Tax=Scheffersomyces spartinae TaxID=45513 RepID=A0A9P8AKR6_9ASCO|nr:uncharacterized protein KQ657_000245 [Scheffersomyces spartinae]KAG7196232.1 hypothetical protein KQ657_000245 [Scheffersomyces spartinae]
MSYNSVQPINLNRKKRKRSNGTSSTSASASASASVSASTSTSSASTSASVASQIPGWPSSLKEFVASSFTRSESELSPEEQNLFRSQITSIVDIALKKNMIWTNDWERQSLPVFDGGDLQLISISDPMGNSNSTATPNTTAAITTTVNTTTSYASKQRKKQRLERFSSEEPEPFRPMYNSYTTDTVAAPVKGTSQQIEKTYLRLTSEPIPSNVRPQNVLEKSWKFVLNKYRHGQPYTYFISQFKSIRQDLTVQNIQNDFTIHIYEVNARVCLEKKDLGEFNQCQTQLTFLYDHVRTNTNRHGSYLSQEVEFIGYRIIYMIILGNYQDVIKLRLQMVRGTYSKLTTSFDGQEAFLSHIDDLFKINDCLLLGDYYNLIKLVEHLKPVLPLAYDLLNDFLLAKERIRIFKTHLTVNSQSAQFQKGRH